VSRGTRVPSRGFQTFAYGAFTLYGQTFQSVLLILQLTVQPLQRLLDGPTTPVLQRLQAYTTQV
jgi:hypothetical protein